MEELKNLNSQPVDQPAAATPKNIPTVAGAMVILIVAVLVGSGLYYIFQTDFAGNSDSNAIISRVPLKAKTETAAPAGDLTTSQIPVVGETAQPAAEETAIQTAAGAAFNFDYELKKLDDQNNSINPDDFNENEISDANIGL